MNETWTNLATWRRFSPCADERSFTRAAAKLGISHSALSHTIRGWKSGWACGC